MRFGCDFRQLQIPLWRDRYLGYDKLKQTLKQQSYKSDIAPQDSKTVIKSGMSVLTDDYYLGRT